MSSQSKGIITGLMCAALCAYGAVSHAADTITGPIFTLSVDGADLLSDPNFSDVGPRTPVASGTSLLLPGPSGDNDNLGFSYSFPDFPPDNLVPGEPVIARVRANITREESDNDPYFGFSDGSSYIGGFFEDNSGGSVQAFEANPTDPITGRSTFNEVTGISGYPGVGGTYDLEVELTLDEFGTDVATSANTTSTGETGLSALDLNSLVFLFAMQDDSQDHRINTFELELIGTTAEEVPEPATVVLFGIGAVLLAGHYHRRRRLARAAG